MGRKGFFLEDYDKDLSEANPIVIANNMHFKSFESNNLAHWACVISLRCRLGCHDIAGRCLYSYNMNDGSNVVKTIVSHPQNQHECAVLAINIWVAFFYTN